LNSQQVDQEAIADHERLGTVSPMIHDQLRRRTAEYHSQKGRAGAISATPVSLIKWSI
jgi:hypothetical protein